MKSRLAMLSCAVIATVALTACSSTLTGTPVPVAASTSSAVQTVVQDNATDSSTSSSTSSEISSSNEPQTSSAAPGSSIAGPCGGLVGFIDAFNKNVLAKATSASVTQGGIDETFSAANVSGIPSGLQPDIAQLKTLAGSLVGKKPEDSIDPLTKIQKVYLNLASRMQAECTR